MQSSRYAPSPTLAPGSRMLRLMVAFGRIQQSLPTVTSPRARRRARPPRRARRARDRRCWQKGGLGRSRRPIRTSLASRLVSSLSPYPRARRTGPSGRPEACLCPSSRNPPRSRRSAPRSRGTSGERLWRSRRRSPPVHNRGPRLEDVDAGVGEGAYGLLGVRLLLEAQDGSLFVYVDHAELRGVRDPVERYGGKSPFLFMEGYKLAYVHVRQGVARDDDESVVEVCGEAFDAPGRPEELFFPAQVNGHAVHRRLLAVGLEQHIRHVVDVDVELPYAVGGQEAEDMLDYGGVRHRGHRLGDLAGERVQTRPLSRRQSHSLHIRPPQPSSRGAC